MRWVQVLAFFLAASLLACAASEPTVEEAPERFRVTEENGVTVATTIGGALHAGNVFTFEPVVRLEQDPHRPESLLFRPMLVTVGAEGFYYVIDGGNNRIAVFDADGKYVRAIGRGGGGPGEFGPQMTLESVVGDILSIFEFGSQRTTRFHTDGTLLETITLPGAGLMIGLDRDPSGKIVATHSNTQEDDDPGVLAWRIDVRDETGEQVLAEVATGSGLSSMVMDIETAAGAAQLSTSIPFAGRPVIQHVPERGILVTNGDKPELFWYDLDGTLRRKVVIDLPMRPITEALKGDWMQRRVERSAAVTANGRTQTVQFPEPPFPETVGFWYWLFVDDAGYVWLLDIWSEEHREDGDGWVFHVVDPQGRYLGLVEAPSSRPRVRRGRLLAIVQDPDSEEMVPTVYAILPGDEGVEYPGSYQPARQLDRDR